MWNKKPEPQKPEGFWSASILAPGALPTYLGRVADSDSTRDPELGGSGPLHNANPVGKGWKLSLSAKSTAGTETAKLDDVQLLLHVAVRARA